MRLVETISGSGIKENNGEGVSKYEIFNIL
jgi:hypothetical protein